MSVINKLKTIRKRDNLTNKELALKIGVSTETVKAYLAGKCNPSVNRLSIIDSLYNGKEILKDPWVIKLADEIEDFVAGKIELNVFDKKFPDVVRLLGNRHCQKELLL